MARQHKDQKKNAAAGDELRQIVTTNRRARHDYEIIDQLDCGMVLTGSEVKSVRNSKIQIEEAYVRVDYGEVWLVGCDIAEYAQASIYNHDRRRKRKLLLKRREIRKFAESADKNGLTLIPLQVFFQRGIAKLRIGLCRGRKLHDKRQRLKETADRREMRAARMKAAPRR
ncbi:MAG: SsrA-binding protein SmpB [Planctomycetaceae bacterium]|jgi:SsrA-binding protein